MFLNFEPSASERARCYRELAKMADENADAATGIPKESYRRLAEQWRLLAAHVERPERVRAMSEQAEERALHVCFDIRLASTGERA